MPDDPQFIPADYFRCLGKREIFPDPSVPLEVDLGCGDGSFLMDLAEAHPERHFLGVERLLGRARKVCRKAARRGLKNLKVLRLESSYTVCWLLPDVSVSRLHLLFPDPWPKKKHHKRRVFRDAEFVAGLERVLETAGEFLFKTDHADYFEEAMEAFQGLAFLERLDWPDEAFFYPETDFERQWKGEGRVIQRARFRKV